LEAAQQCQPRGLAVPAMRLAAHLDPDGHPQTLWTTEAITTYLTHNRTSNEEQTGGAVDARQAKAALRLLHRYALLTCDPHSGDRAVRLHALTARAARESTPTSQIPGITQAVANALYAIWPEEDHTDRELCTTLRANTETLALHAEDHLWGDGSPHVIYRCGESLLTAGFYFSAVRHWQHAASKSELHSGPSHADTLKAFERLASSYWQAGRTGEAISIDERVTAERERLLGEEHPHTLQSWNNLASSYRQAGRTGEAIAIQERVAAERERLLGEEHPDTHASQEKLRKWKADPPG
jgi:tetratricopeptide (TPR) repeat protein